MVHYCLQIPEIVSIICEIIYFTRDGGFDHHRTLATMAKVCSNFRFWAEKLIWTDMHSILPLIMSLPKELWSIDGEESGDPVLVFTRQPTAQEVKEFVAKSRRIYRLTLPRRTFPWKGEAARKAEFLRVAPEVYAMLHLAALAAGQVLFPNLVSISILDPCPELELLYDHFGPKLTEVDIDLNLYMRANSICKTFLDHLRRHNPGIRSVKIELAPPDVLGETVCALPQLKRIETQSHLTPKSLRHLGALDTLKNLTFKLDPSHPPSEWLSPLTFKSLRSLTCQCENVNDAIYLLSEISHCHLTHLEIEVTFHDTWSNGSNDLVNPFPSPSSAQKDRARRQKWKELVQAASHNVNPSSLNSLRIKERQLNAWYYDASPLDFDSIEPLLAFRNLRELEIYAAGGIFVKDRDHSNLIRYLPLLKCMDIGPPIVRSPTDQDSLYNW